MPQIDDWKLLTLEERIELMRQYLDYLAGSVSNHTGMMINSFFEWFFRHDDKGG